MENDRMPADATAAYEQALARMGTEPVVLRLYVAGTSPRSLAAIETVRRVCDEYLNGYCTLEVIDIYHDRGAFSEDVVLATPTLIRRLPQPLQVVVGDMSREEQLLVGLDLVPAIR